MGIQLRRTAFVVFIVFAVVLLWFFRSHLPMPEALLGAVVSLLTLHVWFLSDALFPELWFGTATLLFLILVRKKGAAQVGAYAFALASVRAADGRRRRVRRVGRRQRDQTAIQRGGGPRDARARSGGGVARLRRDGRTQRCVQTSGLRIPACAVPVLQRELRAQSRPLRDPFDPARGGVNPVRRVVRGALELPASLGEILTITRFYLDTGLHSVFGGPPGTSRIVAVGVFGGLWIVGSVLVGGGVALQLLRGDWPAPLYLLAYLGALSVTPFLGQYLRYLAPVAALPVLSAIVLLRMRGTRAAVTALATTLILQLAVVPYVYAYYYEPVAYRDACRASVAYKLFCSGPSRSVGFDEAVDYLQSHAHASDIVAAGTPHWVYLRTGLRAVMPPFEHDPSKTQLLLDGVPVDYLLVGRDVIASERFTEPAVRMFPERWEQAYASTVGGWTVYHRIAR